MLRSLSMIGTQPRAADDRLSGRLQPTSARPILRLMTLNSEVQHLAANRSATVAGAGQE